MTLGGYWKSTGNFSTTVKVCFCPISRFDIGGNHGIITTIIELELELERVQLNTAPAASAAPAPQQSPMTNTAPAADAAVGAVLAIRLQAAVRRAVQFQKT